MSFKLKYCLFGNKSIFCILCTNPKMIQGSGRISAIFKPVWVINPGLVKLIYLLFYISKTAKNYRKLQKTSE